MKSENNFGSCNYVKLNLLSSAILLVIFTLISSVIGCNPFYNRYAKSISSEGDPRYKQASTESHFVGTAERESLESSRNDARLDAQRQIIESLGMRIDVHAVCNEIVNITEKRTVSNESSESSIQEATSYTDSVRIKTAAKAILKVKPDGYYTETYKAKEHGQEVIYYQTWCRIRFDRDEHIKAANEYALSNLTMADAFTQTAEKSLSNKKIIRFLESLNEAYNLNEEVLTLSGVSYELTGRARTISDKVSSLRDNINMGILIRYSNADYKNAKIGIQASLIEQLTASTFMPRMKPIVIDFGDNLSGWLDMNIHEEIAKANNVELLLMGTIEDINVGKLSGNFFSANLQVCLVLSSPYDDAVLWSTKTIVTGVGNTPAEAVDNAAKFETDQARVVFKEITTNLYRVLTGLSPG